MVKKIIYITIGLAIFICCIFIIYRSYNIDSSDNLDVPYDEVNKGVMDIEKEAVTNITENISSPVEIAALINSLGAPFSRGYLAPTEYSSTYSTNYAKSFALGVFSADLGYLNMYNKTGTVLDYLSTIKRLATDINVGQFFDFETLTRLASNSTNLDSLKYISVHSFNLMDKSLRERKMGKLSALIIAGAWLEGIYITVEVTKDIPDQKLIEKIGEQKIILGDLMLLLTSHAKDPIFKNYVNEFNLIKGKFDGIEIIIEQGDPVQVEVDGVITFKGGDKSFVHISTEQLKLITKTVEEVRNRLIRM